MSASLRRTVYRSILRESAYKPSRIHAVIIAGAVVAGATGLAVALLLGR